MYQARIKELVDAMPPLTPEKAARIRALLFPGAAPAGDAVRPVAGPSRAEPPAVPASVPTAILDEGPSVAAFLDAPLPRLFTLEEVAEHTGLSARGLAEACRKREVEWVRFGRGMRMTREQVEKLIRDHTVTTVQDDRWEQQRALIQKNRERREKLRRTREMRGRGQG